MLKIPTKGASLVKHFASLDLHCRLNGELWLTVSQCAIWDMITNYTRIDPSEWKFLADRIDGRRARPLTVKHPAAAPRSEIIAAIALFFFALLAAADTVEAAPHTRVNSYGFSESFSSWTRIIASCHSNIYFVWDHCHNTGLRWYHKISWASLVDRALGNRDRISGRLHGWQGDGAASEERGRSQFVPLWARQVHRHGRQTEVRKSTSQAQFESLNLINRWVELKRSRRCLCRPLNAVFIDASVSRLMGIILI